MTKAHDRMMPIAPGFCRDNLRFVVACSDDAITNALADLPVHDLARLARLVRKAADAEPRRRGSRLPEPKAPHPANEPG